MSYVKWAVKQGLMPPRPEKKTAEPPFKEYDRKHRHLWSVGTSPIRSVECLPLLLDGFQNPTLLDNGFLWRRTPLGSNHWSEIDSFWRRGVDRPLTTEELAYIYHLLVQAGEINDD